MTIGDVPDYTTIRVNNDSVEKVKYFKYLGTLKSSYARYVLLVFRDGRTSHTNI